MPQKDEDLQTRYEEQLAHYKEFCRKVAAGEMTQRDREMLGDEPFDETHFGDLSVGYFAALGVPWADCFALSTLCRYTLPGYC